VRTLWFAIGLLALPACVASAQGDPEPPPPSGQPAATPAPPSEVDVVAAVAEPTPEPQPEPEPVRSKVRRKAHVVAKSIQPGLAAFVEALPGDGTIWVGPLPGNGDRDVVVYLPPAPDDDADFELVYHFHGTYSEHIERERPGLDKKQWVGWNRLQQTIDATDELQRTRGHNFALVYPISAGKRKEPGYEGWFNKAYDRMWMYPTDDPQYADSFERLHEDVLGVLTELGVAASRVQPRVTAEGHSAGGVALWNIAQHGGANVAEYIFQDAGFQEWADGCFDAVRAAKRSSLVTLVITDKGIADPLQGRTPWCTDLEREGGEEWTRFATWCNAMKTDMADEPGVYVHRTKIRHGDQPRHFTGGLELPAKRFEKD
jgi:pimeloyl-ACP methyl ester carboxylesterase